MTGGKRIRGRRQEVNAILKSGREVKSQAAEMHFEGKMIKRRLGLFWQPGHFKDHLRIVSTARLPKVISPCSFSNSFMQFLTNIMI